VELIHLPKPGNCTTDFAPVAFDPFPRASQHEKLTITQYPKRNTSRLEDSAHNSTVTGEKGEHSLNPKSKYGKVKGKQKKKEHHRPLLRHTQPPASTSPTTFDVSFPTSVFFRDSPANRNPSCLHSLTCLKSFFFPLLSLLLIDKEHPRRCCFDCTPFTSWSVCPFVRPSLRSELFAVLRALTREGSKPKKEF
jgi:hypothetical protein